MPRVAVVQAGSVAFDLDATFTRFESLAREAADAGAELAVFPEAFFGGYPKGADFGTRVGFRKPEGRELYRRYHDAAIEVPGPWVARIGEVAAACKLAITVGVIEREGGSCYCTALLFDATGKLLGKHRKLVPTAMERLIWAQGDGSTLPVVDNGVGRTGAAICWENYMPLLRTAMYQKGVELYCAPTVDDREVWISTMRHIALEGRCFVLSSCQFATRGDFPDDYASSYGDDPSTVLIRGGSCIVSPLGELLVGPQYERSGVFTADIDLGAIAEAKLDLDVVGHYGRPDVFSLRVNEAEQRNVHFESEAE